uniref:WW domain-containing protein n=1 Tax=Lotharella globosa TaxID=91324 RepID=A0A7S3YI89_9EUKA
MSLVLLCGGSSHLTLIFPGLFVLFAFAASCAGFIHWNGSAGQGRDFTTMIHSTRRMYHNFLCAFCVLSRKDGYCTKDGSTESYCETWKASVAFTWILFWGFTVRVYFALSHYQEGPPQDAELADDEAPEQDYDVLEDERGNADAVAPAAAAPKWQEFIDDTTGAPYWHNAETGVSTWTKPEGM